MSELLRPVGVTPILLADLVGQCDGVELRCDRDPADVLVADVTLDSRTVEPGTLYVALPGTRAHGADFAASAAELGAVAVLTDEAGAGRASAAGLPVVVAADPRAAMADVAAVLFDHPADALTMFGLTGTNGKTTTCFLLEAGLAAASRHVGTIGTNGFRLDQQPIESGRTTVTTPESPDLQALLAVMRERGAEVVAMEVSSHALALQRVNGICFDVAGFTNLGRDHLDFHPDMDDYFRAKAKLFAPGRCRVAVINVDDEYGHRLAEMVSASDGVRLVTTGFGESDYRIQSWTALADGSQICCSTPDGERHFKVELPGEYNVRNAVMALAMLVEAGLDADAVLAGLAHAQVPGRMELVRLDGAEAPRVHVDFAHTPQAIASAIRAVSPAEGGRRIVVLGAGGDRDKAKRGPMGAEAAALADMVVVTDDNPRTEDPEQIRRAVVQGARDRVAAAGRHGVVVSEVPGRAAAIAHALQAAGPSDVVLLLGKGHEQGQIVGSQVLPFDDRSVAVEAWQAIGRSRR